MSDDSSDPWRVPDGIDPTPERTFASVMVTGHRPQHLSATESAWAQAALHTTAWRLRSKYGMREGISGLALGADTWWALAVLGCGASLAVYIPFEEQARPWPDPDKALWAELRGRARRERVAGGDSYDVRHLHARNDQMLDDTIATSGLVVALHKTDSTGGTASVVAKARRRGAPLLLLDPTNRSIRRDGW